MTSAQHLYQLADIIANYAVKDHSPHDGADYDQLEEIKRIAKDLSKYSPDYETVYNYAEEVQEYIMKKSKRSMKKEK